ncbi:MAG: GLPGLI family protein [Treponema sp.]|nr:GLPGLI family protein [Treponema sp.]
MERKLLLVIVLAFTASCFAQGPNGVSPLGTQGLETDKYTVLDSALYKFSYKLTCVVDTERTETAENWLVLLIGKNYSKMFNFYPPHPELKSGVAKPNESRGLGGTEVFKDFAKKTMEVTIRVFMPKDVFLYEEELPQQAWTITDDTKQIHGYDCQKATTKYLGRDYEVWYTLEIPISNGPWKLGGLPGMILEAGDVQRHYVFNCVGIEKLNKREPIVKYDWHYVRTTREAVNGLIKRMCDDMDAYLSSIIQPKDHKPVYSPRPYNPLERE